MRETLRKSSNRLKSRKSENSLFTQEFKKRLFRRKPMDIEKVTTKPNPLKFLTPPRYSRNAPPTHPASKKRSWGEPPIRAIVTKRKGAFSTNLVRTSKRRKYRYFPTNRIHPTKLNSSKEPNPSILL